MVKSLESIESSARSLQRSYATNVMSQRQSSPAKARKEKEERHDYRLDRNKTNLQPINSTQLEAIQKKLTSDYIVLLPLSAK